MNGTIHLLFTGGTISMHRDAGAGGNVPAHGGEALVRFAEGLERIAPYRVEDWAKLPACHLRQEQFSALRERVHAIAAAGEVRGIVVTHGTDLLEETAYLLARTLDSALPVVVTGAMRTSSDDGWDGPRNLLDAAAVAAAPDSAGRGAMVVFAGRVFRGSEAVKVHTVGIEAFDAPHGSSIGRVARGEVCYTVPVGSARPPVALPHGLTARIALVPMVAGDEGTLLDAARPGHDGVVLIGFGSGNVPPGAVPAVGRWLEEGKPVVLASRCPFGEVSPLYAFEGGGAGLVGMGVIPAGPRTPSQARMELMIACSAGVEYGA